MYGLLAYINHDIVPHIFISHTIHTLDPILPLSLPSLRSITQHMDEDWVDMSHVGTGHGALTNHGYDFALVKNAK